MAFLRSGGPRWLSSASPALDQAANLSPVRSVLRLSGPTLVHFLQGLLTQDVTPLEGPAPPPLYACILNAQGRYLHDLFLHPLPPPGAAASGPAVLVDTDAAGKDDLLRLLKRYRLRQKIDIDDVSQDFEVWARFGGSSGGGGGRWPADPRLPALGSRAVLPAGAAPPEDTEVAPWEAYRRHRIALGVAEGDSEIPSGESIAIEFNVDGLNGISFTKGCYVGQELMARTHFKGVVRKRVLPVEVVVGGGAAAAGEAVVDAESGKTVGAVRVVDGDRGLALLRLREAGEAAAGRRALRAAGGAALRPLRPAWWPETWGREE